MTILSDYVSRMVEGGMDQDEAMQIAAELFAAGVASAAVRPSAGAIRTRKWREANRHKASPRDGHETQEDGATKRHEPSQSVTSDNASLSKRVIDIKKDEKKRERRATQIPDGWKPDDRRWSDACKALGGEQASRELRKFTNHALEKGRVAKNWNAAWDNWVDRAVEWAPKGQPPPKGARATTVHQARQVEGREVLDALREFNASTGDGSNPGVLRQHSGDGAEGICGGPGGNLVRLPASSDRSRG